jgi:hypothetical protein
MRGILGSNEKVVCACIGIRSRGKAHVLAIQAYPNAYLKYNCDVDDHILEEHNAWCEEHIGRVPQAERDFRKILDDPEVDAIFIATPEHWHAPMAAIILRKRICLLLPSRSMESWYKWGISNALQKPLSVPCAISGMVLLAGCIRERPIIPITVNP